MNAQGRHLSSTLVRNALFGSGARVITLAVGLVMTPYLLVRLGADRFGIWALVAVVTGAAGLLDFSLKSAFVKYLSEAVALKNRAASAAILSTGLFAYALFALAVGVIFFLGSGAVLDVLNIPLPLLEEARHVFLVGVAGYLVSSVLSVFPAVCDARQRMDITNSLGVAALFTGACLTVLAVESGLGLPGVAWAQFVGIAAFYLSCIVAAGRISGPLGISYRAVSREWFLKLFAFGWRLHVSSMCAIVNRQLDKLILSRWAGLTTVASYEVALRAASNVGTLQPYLAAALLPASSQIHAAGQRERLQAVYRKSTRYLFLAGIPPFVYLAVHSRTAITAWLGEPNPVAALILICLVPGYLVNSLSNGMAFVCQGMGRPGIQARQSALQLGLNVILSLMLFHMIGPIGAPIGTSIALILGAAYFAWSFHPHLGIATLPLLRETASVPLAGSLLGVLVAWLLTGEMSEFGRADALLKLGASFAVFAAVATGFCLAVRYVGLSELKLVMSALRSHDKRVLP